MDKADIERQLFTRVEETKSWDLDDPNETITNLILRKKPCTATPIMRVGEPDRVESYGVRFRLEYVGEDGNYFCHLDLRFRPTFVGSDDPYVVAYVVDDDGNNDEITHNVIRNNNIAADLTIKEWYAKWIQYAFRQEKHKKIFVYKRPVEG
jgi:hypothetical protein